DATRRLLSTKVDLSLSYHDTRNTSQANNAQERRNDCLLHSTLLNNSSLSNVSPMIPGSLVPKTKTRPDHRASGLVLAVPDPSVARLKCSWHLGMMMRIIRTLLLKTQATCSFPRKNYLSS